MICETCGCDTAVRVTFVANQAAIDFLARDIEVTS